MSILELPSTQAQIWAVPILGPKSGPSPRRWTREEYYQLAELGCFRDQRVELIDGEIIQLPPQSFGHSFSLDAIFHLLLGVFQNGYWVRSQLPLIGGGKSEAEPDIAVIKGDRETHREHPKTAVLVVEVSSSSLEYDKLTKSSLYSGIGVPDYWIVDLENRVLEVRRNPIKDRSQQFGWRYDDVQIIDATGSISPLEKPDAKLTVAAMLPPVKA